jgi:hypothetical protein
MLHIIQRNGQHPACMREEILLLHYYLQKWSIYHHSDGYVSLAILVQMNTGQMGEELKSAHMHKALITVSKTVIYLMLDSGTERFHVSYE